MYVGYKLGFFGIVIGIMDVGGGMVEILVMFDFNVGGELVGKFIV